MPGVRKYYIDELRWLMIALLIPYHAAMAWNTWNEPNYIIFSGSRVLSSIVVSLSPFLMPVLFVLAGISTRYSLRRRTVGQYLLERVKKLLVPFLFGTLVLMPPMTYIADCFNCGYKGSFLGHYRVFFTKFTDLTGADGGFSVGHFWFLIYLLVISAAFIPLLKLQQKYFKKPGAGEVTLRALLLAGLPLLLLHEVLSVGGKSLAEYLYLFLLGYYVFSDDRTVEKLSEHRWALLAAGAAATAIDTYLFIWSGLGGTAVNVINTLARGLAEWSMVLAALGLSAHFCTYEGAVTRYMSRRSFMFYIFHYIWLVLFQYLLHDAFACSTLLLFLLPAAAAYGAALLCCEVFIRIPPLCLFLGSKPLKK